MMPTAFDDDFLPLATELLAEFGVSRTITIPAAGAFDPIEGERIRGAPVEHEWITTPPSNYREFFADQSAIKSGDAQVIMAAADIPFTPSLVMLVAIGDERWRVTAIEPIVSGELVAAYLVNLSRGAPGGQ